MIEVQKRVLSGPWTSEFPLEEVDDLVRAQIDQMNKEGMGSVQYRLVQFEVMHPVKGGA